VTVAGASPAPPTGYTVGTLAIGAVATVSFRVTVATIPTVNPIPNDGSISYVYNITPTSIGTGGDNTNQVTTNISQASLDSTKEVSSSSATLGDILTYTIALSNPGNVEVYNVKLIDTIPNGTTLVPNSVFVNGVPDAGSPAPPSGLTIGTIAGGTITTVTFQVTVASVPNPNPIVNRSSSSYNFNVGTVVNTGSSGSNPVLTTVSFGNLTSNKNASPAGISVGGTVVYSIVLKNTGISPVYNVTVIDTIADGASFIPNSVRINSVTIPGVSPEPLAGLSVPTIAAGSTSTVTFQVVVTTIPASNSLINEATTFFNYDLNPTTPISGTIPSNITTTPVNQGDIEAVKASDPSTATIGDVVTYIVSIENTGNVPVYNVNFIDTIPNGTTFVANSVKINDVTLPGASPAPIAGVSVGTISAGTTTTLSFKVTIATLPSPNPILNIGNVRFTYNQTPTIPITKGTGTNTATTDISQGSVTMSKAVDFVEADLGYTVTYTLVLRNKGNVPVYNTTIIDTVPNGGTFIPNSLIIDGIPDVGSPEPPIGAIVPTIPQGSSSTVTFQITVTTMPSPNPMKNIASMSFTYFTNPTTPNSGSGTSNAVNTKVNHGDIKNTKAANNQFTTLNETLIFTITLVNTGNVPVNNVFVQDTIPTGTSFINNSVKVNNVTVPGGNPQTGISITSIAPGGIATVSFAVTVNTVPSPNSISNQAITSYRYTVISTNPNGAIATVPSNVTDSKVNIATISAEDGGLVKTVDKLFADLGDTITYTIALKNTGNVNADSVVLYDTIPKGTIFIADSVTVDFIIVPGVSPQNGVSIGSIAPTQVVTVSYQVVVNSITIPTPDPIPNYADVAYSFNICV
ncbi:beta strand repeat-containing protein, partial [Romboutsia sp.]|uniref:beta strand repeat-containing protein n=1 Tax=Romboutsia sp. TaxID=1965302 RepID=UPI003F30E819